jgi:hypothetical protein
MIPYAEPWLMHRLCTTSPIVTHLSPRIVADSLVFPSAVDVDGCPDPSSVTLVRRCLNMVIHSHTRHCSKALFPHFTESLQWIFAPGTSSAHKNCITAHCCSLMLRKRSSHVNYAITLNWSVKVESISHSCREFVLLPACKISSAAKRASFKLNHCRNFLPHPEFCRYCW